MAELVANIQRALSSTHTESPFRGTSRRNANKLEFVKLDLPSRCFICEERKLRIVQ